MKKKLLNTNDKVREMLDNLSSIMVEESRKKVDGIVFSERDVLDAYTIFDTIMRSYALKNGYISIDDKTNISPFVNAIYKVDMLDIVSKNLVTLLEEGANDGE